MSKDMKVKVAYAPHADGVLLTADAGNASLSVYLHLTREEAATLREQIDDALLDAGRE